MTRKIKLDKDLVIGDGSFTFIAGPCAVESYEQMLDIGKFLKEKNVRILRGGAFKPRTDPHSFQGLGIVGLKILKEIKKEFSFKIISEIMDPRDIEVTQDIIDIYQIGSRNMYNYSLLREVAKTSKPIMLKRGMNATYEEWIKASEYISIEGNLDIILCERGIRTFENFTRNTLDLMAIPIIRSKVDYPIFIDPSHGTGKRDLIYPATLASKALGADGVIIEIHQDPENALSDGQQSLNFSEFETILNMEGEN